MRITYLLIFIILVFNGCREDFSNIVTYNSVSGEIADEATLEPIANARISTNPITGLSVTDDLGRFSLDSLTSTIYTIRVVADGYQNKISSFDLDDLDNNSLLVLMEKDSVLTFPPSMPFNPSPVNNAIDQNLEVTLSWSARDDKDSLTYEVTFYRPEDINPETILSGSIDTSVVVSNLTFNSTYYWQVKVTDRDGLSALSPTWNFKTIEFPEELYRFAFVRNVDEFDQIFIGRENGDIVQITNDLNNHWRPTFSPQRDKIGFLKQVNGEIHLHSMDRNGENIKQITNTRPLRTKRILDAPFCWAENGNRLIYMDLDRLISITRDGTGLFEYGFESNNKIITSVDHTDLNGGQLIVTTEEPSGNISSIYLYNIQEDSQVELLDSIEGRYAHGQFSPSGREVIFTFNAIASFSTNGIPLNQRIFHYDLETTLLTELSGSKPGGTADRNPRFSQNGARVLFNNSLSDGIGEKRTLYMDLEEALTSTNPRRDTLFSNSDMIDWE